MQIIIKGRQMQVTPQLRQRIERKVQRLSRLVGGETRVEVTVAEEQTRSARDRFSVHLALSANSHPVRSDVSALNASTALDLAIDKVEAQLGRMKNRITKERRHHIPIKVLALTRSGQVSSLDEEEEMPTPDELSALEEEHNENIWSRIVEIRSLPARPMSDQEVIMEMEKRGSLFFPFFNEATNSVNVMYKLEQGGYGLLVPAVE